MDRALLNAGCEKIFIALGSIDEKLRRMEDKTDDERLEIRKKLDAICGESRAWRAEQRQLRQPREFPLKRVNWGSR